MLGLLAVVAVSAAVTMWARIDRFEVEVPGSASGGVTYLFIGSDSRSFVSTAEDEVRYGNAQVTPGERADVIFLARVDDDGSTRLLSIPRDLLVARDRRLIRVSETMLGGPQGVVDSICQSLGVGVGHVVVVDLDGLRDVANAIGGVEMTFETPVRDRVSGLRFDAGPATLSGDDVLAYVGSRHFERRSRSGRWTAMPVEGADRPGRAAVVLRSLAEGAAPSWGSPVRSLRVLWAASGGVSVDGDLSIRDLDRLRRLVGHLSSVGETRLPVSSSGDRVPVDQLAEGAATVLRRFEGADAGSSGCEDPALPLARRGDE